LNRVVEIDEVPDTPVANAARMGALQAARSVEMRLRRRKAEQRDAPITLELLGRYLRRSRRLAEVTQRDLALQAGVSQTMLSRAERGAAAAMPMERFVAMVTPLDRLFPFGCCPHDHNCAWQPVRPPQIPTGKEISFIERMLLYSGET